jgi:hypothetical protein
MNATLIGKNAIDSMVNVIDDYAFGNDDVSEDLVDAASNISNALKMISLCDDDDDGVKDVKVELNDSDLLTLGKIYAIGDDSETESDD